MSSMESRLALSCRSAVEKDSDCDELEEEEGVDNSWLGTRSISLQGYWEGSVGEGYSHCPAHSRHLDALNLLYVQLQSWLNIPHAA